MAFGAARGVKTAAFFQGGRGAHAGHGKKLRRHRRCGALFKRALHLALEFAELRVIDAILQPALERRERVDGAFFKASHSLGRFVAFVGILAPFPNARLKLLEFSPFGFGRESFFYVFRCLHQPADGDGLPAAPHCAMGNLDTFGKLLATKLGSLRCGARDFGGEALRAFLQRQRQACSTAPQSPAAIARRRPAQQDRELGQH